MTEGRKGDGGVRRFGVVLFDNTADPRSGWASVNGETAQVIATHHELSNDTLWLTNLGYDEMRASNLSQNPSLRPDYYLPIKLEDLLAEWGLDAAEASLSYIAKFASVLFARIMGISWRLLKETNPALERSRAFIAPSLKEDLRSLMPAMDYPSDEAWHGLKKGQGMKDFSPTETRRPRGGRTVTFRRPRLAHTLDMLASPVPHGKFAWVGKNQMRGGGDRTSWVRENDRPCMVNAIYQGLLGGPAAGDVASVFAFSNAISKGAEQRNWMAHPEFMVFSTFARLEVLGVWQGEGYRQLNLELPHPVREFLSSRFSEMSWSAGIVAESLLRAAFLGDPAPRKLNQDKQGERSPNTSWQGVWLRAADRMTMFALSMDLTREGFSVTSYGVNWIKCSATEDQVPDLIQHAMRIGLVPQYLDIPEGLFRQNAPLPWNGDSRGAALVGMIARRQQSLLWNLDRIPMAERDRHEEMFLRIREQVAAGVAKAV